MKSILTLKKAFLAPALLLSLLAMGCNKKDIVKPVMPEKPEAKTETEVVIEGLFEVIDPEGNVLETLRASNLMRSTLENEKGIIQGVGKYTAGSKVVISAETKDDYLIKGIKVVKSDTKTENADIDLPTIESEKDYTMSFPDFG